MKKGITGPVCEYYVQDTRQIVGNDLMWWAIDGKGYTSDISRAEVWGKEEAFEQCEMTPHFRPWPKDYIDRRTRPAVDVQYVNIHDTGVKIPKRKERRPKVRPTNCCGCGRFLDGRQCVTGCDHCESAP